MGPSARGKTEVSVVIEELGSCLRCSKTGPCRGYYKGDLHGFRFRVLGLRLRNLKLMIGIRCFLNG